MGKNEPTGMLPISYLRRIPCSQKLRLSELHSAVARLNHLQLARDVNLQGDGRWGIEWCAALGRKCSDMVV